MQLKHVQVREYVRDLLAASLPGTPVPSERELVQKFGVARMTVRQAIDGLVTEGLLERVPGRGTFVAEPVGPSSGITGFTEDMRRRGMRADAQTLIARREKAGPGVARALSLTSGDPVVHWKRLRQADGTPMCIEDAYLSEVLLPGFLQAGMPTSLYAALDRRGLRPTWAEDAISADRATEDEAQLLEIAADETVLRVARRALHKQRPIAVSRAVYPASRFTLFVQYADS